MKKLIIGLGVALSNFYWLAAPAFAQVEKIEVTKPPGAMAEFSPVISGALKIIMVVAALICFVYIIWGGLEWIISGGEKTAVTAARARLTAAFYGLMIILAAWAIIKLLEYLFGFDILKFEFPELY